MLKLAIFDFDGLMVNTEDVVYAAEREISIKYEYEMTWEYYAAQIGLPVEEALRVYKRDISLPVPFEQFVSERHIIVKKFLEEKLAVMPGLKDLLTFLRKHHIPMAIATSGRKKYVLKHLKKFHLTAYFDAVVSIDDVERGKPHPDLVLKTLDIMRCLPEDAFMLEDAPHGITAAKGAHVFTIAVPHPTMNLSLFRDADCICKSLIEVQNLLSLCLPR